MEKIIEAMSSRIEKIGGLEYSLTEDSITVQRKLEQGFKVTLWIDRDRTFVINYGHFWHGHFDGLKEAEDCFISGVMGTSRLVCTYHWRYLTRAVFEIKSNRDWQQMDEVGSCLGFIVWWMPKRIEVFQNILVKETKV